MNVIDLSAFLPKDNLKDATPAVYNALKQARSLENPILLFPKGVWHFYPDMAYEKHYFISNNDNGLKRIAFPLIDFNNITIDGNGSEFIMHGRITPFIVDKSKNVTIKNFSVDAPFPFYGQAKVASVGEGYIDIDIDREKFAGNIIGDMLVFETPEWENDSNGGLFIVEFDKNKTEPAWHKGTPFVIFHGKSKDSYFSGDVPMIKASQNGKHIRITGNMNHGFDVGDNIYMGFENRANPCIFVNKSENVTVKDVSIYHSASMGAIAQLSKNITLERVSIGIRPGSDRIVSAAADATHYVNCMGKIVMKDCSFFNMMDDATNIHGIYTTVLEKTAPNQIIVQFQHFQQWGVDLYEKSDTLYFVDRSTMEYISTAVVSAVEVINSRHTLLTLEADLGDDIPLGTAVELPDKMPEVELRGVKSGNNRSRGFLITTPKKVVIEDCEFHNSAVGIHFTGDANFWFESGPVRDVTVKNCLFNDVGYGYNTVSIGFEPAIDTKKAKKAYHSGVTIEDNLFICNSSRILQARSCSNLVFRNNRVKKSEQYPYTVMERPVIDLDFCPDAVIEPPVEE